MLNKINHNGMDAILTVAIIDTETETRYIPGDYRSTPFRMYNFWGYYSYWYPRIYNSGYYLEDKVYFIETNLYDAVTEELLWSAQSESYNPASLQEIFEGTIVCCRPGIDPREYSHKFLVITGGQVLITSPPLG